MTGPRCRPDNSTVLHAQLAHVAACHRGGSANVGRFDGAKMFSAVSQDIDVPAGAISATNAA